MDNCAHAHVLAWQGLQKEIDAGHSGLDGQNRVSGEAFLVGEHTQNMWEHMRPFLASCGLTVPRVRVPVALMLLFGYVVELLCWVLCKCGVHYAPNFTVYTILAVSRDFYFSSEKARRVSGYVPPVDRETAVSRTCAWLQLQTLRDPASKKRA